jgi:death-on-curing family protein
MSNMPENDVWYPDEKLVLEVHKTMLKKYGGWQGYECGIDVYSHILDEAKKAKGVYSKAAVFLRKLVSGRIFVDGNHRTAQAITETFLEMNNAQMKVQETEEIIMFIKHILEYNLEEIAEWLENGTTKRPNQSVP